MKRIATFIAAVAACVGIGLVACGSTKGSGEKIIRTVKLNGKFKEIDVNNGLVVNYVVVDCATGVTAAICGPREFNERVKVRIKDKELHFGTVDGRSLNLPKGEQIIINASGPAAYKFDAGSGSILNIASPLSTKGKLSLDASSGATINAAGRLSAKELLVDCSSGSIVNLSANAKAETLCVDISSGAVASIKADCTSAAIDLSSGAVVNLIGSATNTAVDASSGAVVNAKNFRVSERLVVDASSGAIINCNAKRVVADKSGSAITNNVYSK